MNDETQQLNQQRALVIGGSRGFGRGIAMSLQSTGAYVTAVARSSAALSDLASQPNIETKSGDLTDATLMGRLVDEVRPDIVVLTAGAQPLMRPLAQFDWESFRVHWDTEVKATFHLLRELLNRKLRSATRVVVFSSGAALSGSPLSGGYASAKQAQRFLCQYARQEAAAREMRLIVQCVLPDLSPTTRLGLAAVAGYADRAGLSPADFAKKLPPALSPEVAGEEIARLLTDPSLVDSPEFRLNGDGLAKLE